MLTSTLTTIRTVTIMAMTITTIMRVPTAMFINMITTTTTGTTTGTSTGTSTGTTMPTITVNMAISIMVRGLPGRLFPA